MDARKKLRVRKLTRQSYKRHFLWRVGVAILTLLVQATSMEAFLDSQLGNNFHFQEIEQVQSLIN